ncbi:MAG TPA: methyl-accepting chemotaxis protein [Syntrophorhabdaceae bacterium]|jgi:methyl-accepting chemotaxis protein WspA
MRKYLRGLRISHKILISSLVFAVPILVLLYFMVAGFNHNIKFSRQEMQGLKVVEPLQKIAELISEHQLLVRLYLEGNKDLEQKIVTNGKAVDSAFTELIKVAREQEGLLKISEGWLKSANMTESHYTRIYKNWQELNATWKKFDNTVQNDGWHETVIQPVLALIKRVGDTSNMVLDPDLETTYLVDVTLSVLPKTQERLTNFILYIESLLYKGFRSKDDVNKLAVYSAFLENDLERIRQSMATVFSEDRDFYGGSPTLQKNIAPALSRYESSLLEFLVIGKLLTSDPGYTMTVSDFLEPSQKVVDAGSALRQTAMGELKILLNKRISSFRTKAAGALSLSILALGFAVTIVLLISRGISRPLGRVAQIAGEVAGGNLQQARESLWAAGQDGHSLNSGNSSPSIGKNEVHQLFYAISAMTLNLDSLLQQVRKSGVQVTSSSAEIAASARELEATVAEQAASINEVSVTSAEISATAQDFASRMNNITRMAATAAELAGSSMDGLSQIRTSMKNLLDSTSQSSEKLGAISEKMGNIGQVITAITKVANQINLLSLNAAIEAEKAGEYGIGFSVVAREIRRLADQTAVAALEIESMITETQASVREGIGAVELYTEQTRDSTGNISHISGDLERVIAHTRELQPHLEAVNQGMHMQSDSAGQISEAMSQLNETARQTRDSLVEFKKVTEQLNEAVGGLQDEVSRFRVSS